MGIYTQLENSVVGKKLIEAGYEIMNTGGGVMAWGRSTLDQALILIGQGDGDIGEDGKENEWGTCVTDADGSYLENLTMKGTLDHCIAEMAKVDAPMSKMPKVGTRVIFTAQWDIFSEDTIIPVGSRGVVVEADEKEFNVLMDKRFANLAEWNNVVYLNPHDFASDNDVTPAGWVLRYMEELKDDEDLYCCPSCEWKGSRLTAAVCDLIVEGEDKTVKHVDGGVMCPVCTSPLNELASLNSLIAEFCKWGDDNGLPPLSADELLSEMYAETNGFISTDEEKEYVRDFIERWEATADAEQKSYQAASELARQIGEHEASEEAKEA